MFFLDIPLKIEGCHDANFVITGGTCSATSDDKVGIVITLNFQCLSLCKFKTQPKPQKYPLGYHP